MTHEKVTGSTKERATGMWEKLYVDMLEYRQQMYESIPYAHHYYKECIELLWLLPLDVRRKAMGLS
jgi:hypothetical protein